MSSPPAPVGRHRLVRRRRVPGGDEHVARRGAVLAAVAQPTDPRLGQRVGQPTVPLLHQHPGRHDHQHEAAPTQASAAAAMATSVLPDPVTASTTPAAAAAQPADQRVELPPVELAGFGSQVREHGSADPSHRHGSTRLPAPHRCRAWSVDDTGELRQDPATNPWMVRGDRCGSTGCWPRPAARRGWTTSATSRSGRGSIGSSTRSNAEAKLNELGEMALPFLVTRLLTTAPAGRGLVPPPPRDRRRAHRRAADRARPPPHRLDGAVVPARRGPRRPLAAALGVEPAVPAAVDRRAAPTRASPRPPPGSRCRRR